MFIQALRWNVAIFLTLSAASCSQPKTDSSTNDKWANHFNVEKANFSSTGRNTYFILEPGYQMRFEGTEDGKPGRLVITVLDQTMQLDGVETRVVEERETSADQLVEVSRNYFAIDRSTGDVYYFGEDSQTYRDGKVAGNGGSWWSGKDGAHFGLFMPAKPVVGQKFYQELAPNVAMDRCEITSRSELMKVPAGNFENCLKTSETSPLEPDSQEYKLYAPDVGLVIDGGLVLVKFGSAEKNDGGHQ